MPDVPKPLLRLPRALAYTTVRCTIVGALACSSSSQGETHQNVSTDASTDAHGSHDAQAEASETGSDAPSDGAPTDAFEGYDSPDACDGGAISLCGAVGPCDGGCPCATTGSYFCSTQCPAGCEPFA